MRSFSSFFGLSPAVVLLPSVRPAIRLRESNDAQYWFMATNTTVLLETKLCYPEVKDAQHAICFRIVFC